MRTLQKLLGHEQLRTTMQYVHVLEQSGEAVTTPLDTLPNDSTWTPRRPPATHNG